MSEIQFSRRETLDLVAAWVILSIAFTVLLHREMFTWPYTMPDLGVMAILIARSGFTVGVGFVFHELAHKVVAVHFGQQARFRADYKMLAIAFVSAFAGFLFAAPGAVVHRGRITVRESGLIALAGPVTNLALAAGFFLMSVLVGSALSYLAGLGLLINLFLAAFNMIPFGPLDGRTVLDWNRGVYAVVTVPSVLLLVYVLVFL